MYANDLLFVFPGWHMSPRHFTFLRNTALIAPSRIAVSLPHVTIESNHEHWRKCEWNRGRESGETTLQSDWWKFQRRTSFQSRWRQKPNRTQMIFIHQASISFHTHKEVHMLSSSFLPIPLIHLDAPTHPHLQHTNSPPTFTHTHTHTHTHSGLNVSHKKKTGNYTARTPFVLEPLAVVFEMVTWEQSVCEAGSRGIISRVVNHKARYLS